MLRRLIIFFSLAVTTGSSVFGQAKIQPPSAPGATKQEDEAPPAMAVPPTYRFQSRGRRDPFVNPVPKPVAPTPVIPVVRPPGLKGVLLSEAVVAAIVVSKDAPDMTRAVINAVGNKTYFARKGDALFDAVVKDIQKDAVVFVLTTKELDGKTTTREVVRKIRSTP